jgi:hypothetical protein
VTNSLFEHLNSQENKGGAIYVWTEYPGSSIVSTSFFDVKVDINDTTYGGAMYFDDSFVIISQCCGNMCYSNDYGSFLALTEDGNHQIEETSIIFSETKNFNGTLYIQPDSWDANCRIKLSSMNFTGCYAKNTGSAFQIGRKEDSFSGIFLILFSLTGDTAIDSFCENECSINFSNIYNNSLNVDKGVFYCHGYGFSIDHCIFNGNTQDICMSTNNISHLFTISNSVFSGTFPANKLARINSGNIAHSITASYEIHYHSTFYCPAATHYITTIPISTISLSFSATAIENENESNFEILQIMGIVGFVLLFLIIVHRLIIKLICLRRFNQTNSNNRVEDSDSPPLIKGDLLEWNNLMVGKQAT